MLSEFLNIIIRSIKLDSSLYNNNKNFGEASIYFAIVIILLTSLISMVPGSVLFKHMSGAFGISGVPGPTLRSILISSFIVWLIKTSYLYFVGVVLFPSNNTKCNFRKLLVVVGFANCPFIFYIFIVNIKLIYYVFIPYVWYCMALIVALKHVLNYESYLKPSIISLAPQALLLIYFLSQVIKIKSGVVS